jgi:uncharacterized protein YggU (UPF0235/DUF167 family)
MNSVNNYNIKTTRMSEDAMRSKESVSNNQLIFLLNEIFILSYRHIQLEAGRLSS